MCYKYINKKATIIYHFCNNEINWLKMTVEETIIYIDDGWETTMIYLKK